MEEEEEPLLKKVKRDLDASMLEAARKRLLTFRGDAFLDWLYEATPEDYQWVLSCVFRIQLSCNNVTLRMNGRDLAVVILVDDKQECHIIRCVGRQGYNYNAACIGDYMWPSRTDDSFKMLTTEVLTLIVSYLKTPQDLFNASRTCKSLYKACCSPSLYEERIPNLLAHGGIDQLPFCDPLFKPHQYYFALCFFTCRTDRDELAYKILDHISQGNIALARYCRNMLSGFGYFPLSIDTKVEIDKHGNMIYPFSGKFLFQVDVGLYASPSSLALSYDVKKQEHHYHVLEGIKTNHNIKKWW